MSDPLIIYDQVGIIQNLKALPIPQTSFLVGTFFAIYYSKTALVSRNANSEMIWSDCVLYYVAV